MAEDWWTDERAFLLAGCKPREMPDFGLESVAARAKSSANEAEAKAVADAALRKFRELWVDGKPPDVHQLPQGNVRPAGLL